MPFLLPKHIHLEFAYLQCPFDFVSVLLTSEVLVDEHEHFLSNKYDELSNMAGTFLRGFSGRIIWLFLLVLMV